MNESTNTIIVLKYLWVRVYEYLWQWLHGIFVNPLKLTYFFIIHILAFFAREALIVSSDEETTRNE